jgi:hypothetical protein
MVDKVDMKKILEEPAKSIAKIKTDESRMSLMYSVITNLSAMMVDLPKIKDAEVKIMTAISLMDAEHQAVFLRMFCRSVGPSWARRLTKTDIKDIFETIAQKCKGTLDEFQNMK